MKYMMIIYESSAAFSARNDNEKQGAYWGSWQAYSQALAEAGVIVSGGALEPVHTGTTLRLHKGVRQVQDGPYAETKEQLGGFYVLEVPNLDAALDWAARCPAMADGAVEVRPLLPMRQG